MVNDPRRGFGIADGLLMVAAIAAGLALFRAWAPDLTAGILWNAIVRPHDGWSFRYAFELSLELGTTVAAPLLTAITPACLIVQIRPPRPRRLTRRPGFVACLVALVAMVAAGLVAILGLVAFSRLEDFAEAPGSLGCIMSPVAGAAVTSSWGVMLLGGIWRPSPSWQDRSGRLVGAGWIVLGVLGLGYVVLAVF